MSSANHPDSDRGAEVARLLHAVSEFLRETPSVGPTEQRLLAELTEELSRVLSTEPTPPTEVKHLAESVSELVQAMKQPEQHGPLAAARERLDKAIVAAEVEAPMATGIVRRLMAALANLGI